MSSEPRKARRKRRTLTSAWSWVANWGWQLVLAGIGVAGLVDVSMDLLSWWCVFGTLYALGTVVYLAIRSRAPRSATDEDDTPRWFERARGPVIVVLTIIPTLIGVTAALNVIVLGSDSELGWYVKLVGVWAMLLAWGFLHWGFAQLYLNQQLRTPHRTLSFPEAPHPGLVEYVYFAFTVGTTFAASDVSVLSTRTRWLVTVHSVLSFFMNAMIIVLSFNTITGAGR
ncbi:DUF1345 domain-containing protein [Microbacterium sp. NPDC057659]|uniref:DUF1345 domain-containing protein n=1 Tax=Microbacterium sp. NPDC057659 TaxID=3346198 RepID=UPI00366DCB49